MLEIGEETKAWFLKKSGYELGGDPYDDNWSDMELAYAYEQGLAAGDEKHKHDFDDGYNYAVQQLSRRYNLYEEP